ncbi:MAG: response regulator [Mycobacteriaceae bacterium]
MVRILLVDDDTLVRSGLRLLLDGARDGRFSVVGEARDGDDALSRITELHPDVVLMDIRMPGKTGIDALRELQGSPDAPPVLMLTAFDAREDIIASLAAGARGFLRKVASPGALVSAIDTVATGQTALGPEVVEHLLERQHRVGGAARDSARHVLSDKERQVAELVSQGMTNERIGEELHLALPTVKTYMSRIMEKLGAENRVQVAVTYLDRL